MFNLLLSVGWQQFALRKMFKDHKIKDQAQFWLTTPSSSDTAVVKHNWLTHLETKEQSCVI